jgi:hypothetical protein
VSTNQISPLQDKATGQADGNHNPGLKTNPLDAPDAKANPLSPGSPSAPDPLLNLAREIQRLDQSGDDPGRLWQLRAAFKAERLRRIEAKLLAVGPHPNLETLAPSQQLLVATIRGFEAALTRTDLTVAEALFLEKMTTTARRLLQKALLAEKQAIDGPKRNRKRPFDEGRW